jgi:hypothetical protein
MKMFHLQSQILELGKVSSESLDFLNSTEKKRTQLQQAQKLKDIFNLYWYTFRVFTQTGRNGVLQLTEEGYTKFHVLLQFGLHGNKDIDDAWFNAEIDYRHDSLAYGIISELEFYDILQNLLEEVVAFNDALYFSAFAWALLDSIADCSGTPPKLRALREVKCITKLENEATMISSYVKDKKVRADMAVNNEKLSSFLTAQKRMCQRKQGIALDDKKIEEVGAYLEFFDKNTWTGSGPGGSGSNKKYESANTNGGDDGGDDGDNSEEGSDDEDKFDANLDQSKNGGDNNQESGDKNVVSGRKKRKKRMTHMEKMSELDEKWRRSTEIRTLLQMKQQDNSTTTNGEIGKAQALEEKLRALREKFYREHMTDLPQALLTIEERLRKRNEEIAAQGKSYLRETLVSFSRRVSNFMGIAAIIPDHKAKSQKIEEDDDDDDDDEDAADPPMLSKPPGGPGFLKQLSQKFFPGKVASN